MKTKGALIREFNQPWKIEEIEMGDPQKGEVKVQMEASGMCHSDHHLVTGGIPMFGFPVLGAMKAPASSSRSVRVSRASPSATTW